MFDQQTCLMNRAMQGYPRVPACAPLSQAGGHRWVTRVQRARRSELGQHARENLQSEVFLIAQSVRSPLNDANLVVQSFHESERDLVLWLAVGGDPIPMSINHLSKFLVGFESLPLEARAPVLEEPPRPPFALVVPELAEGLLEQVGRVQSLVGRKQRPKRLSALQSKILT